MCIKSVKIVKLARNINIFIGLQFYGLTIPSRKDRKIINKIYCHIKIYSHFTIFTIFMICTIFIIFTSCVLFHTDDVSAPGRFLDVAGFHTPIEQLKHHIALLMGIRKLQRRQKIRDRHRRG